MVIMSSACSVVVFVPFVSSNRYVMGVDDDDSTCYECCRLATIGCSLCGYGGAGAEFLSVSITNTSSLLILRCLITP